VTPQPIERNSRDDRVPIRNPECKAARGMEQYAFATPDSLATWRAASISISEISMPMTGPESPTRRASSNVVSPHGRFEAADAQTFPFPAQDFDLVFSRSRSQYRGRVGRTGCLRGPLLGVRRGQSADRSLDGVPASASPSGSSPHAPSDPPIADRRVGNHLIASDLSGAAPTAIRPKEETEIVGMAHRVGTPPDVSRC
jgi:hypothetical protein